MVSIISLASPERTTAHQLEEIAKSMASLTAEASVKRGAHMGIILDVQERIETS